MVVNKKRKKIFLYFFLCGTDISLKSCSNFWYFFSSYIFKLIKDNIINKYPTLISKILNSDSNKVVLNKPKNITCEYIICDNKELQNLFLEISDKLID